MKTFQMNPNTALDNKTKELIGLAVASQIPCQYCIYFHTEAARANGASEQQIREAVGMSAVVRMASTVINGTQVDNVQFRKDVQRMFKEGGKKPPQAAQR
jgi:AhpD family alkylhydroperoxidase